MTIEVSAFAWVPPFAQGLVRDLRVRWALESGAIVLHIAERCEVTLPADPTQSARAKTWMFAALNSVEPPIMFLNYLQMVGATEAAALEKPITERAQRRLQGLAGRLNAREYLEAQFTAGDLLMSTVLRILRTTDLLSTMPALAAYQARCEARPAFQKALRAHMETFRMNQP
jgi:glutathione S-transferase